MEGQADGSDCKRFIKLAKQYSGFYFKRAAGEPLWQRYGFERVLRNAEQTLVVAKYIVENPVRAGLVQRAEDYRFIGSMAYPLPVLIAGAADGLDHRSA